MSLISFTTSPILLADAARPRTVVSVRRGLTVWCQSGIVSLTTPWGSSQEWGYADLVEAAEQTVRRSEELDLEQDPSGVR